MEELWLWAPRAGVPLSPENVVWGLIARHPRAALAPLDRAGFRAAFAAECPGLERVPAIGVGGDDAAPRYAEYFCFPATGNSLYASWWDGAVCLVFEINTIGEWNGAVRAAVAVGCETHTPRFAVAWEADPAFRDVVAADLAADMKRYAGSLPADAVEALARDLRPEQFADLYERLRARPDAPEADWRTSFLEAFPGCADRLPARD